MQSAFQATTKMLHYRNFAAQDGRVLQGPPQRPLPRILLQQKGDELFAVGIDLGEA
jgi:Rieske Fe-S protein